RASSRRADPADAETLQQPQHAARVLERRLEIVVTRDNAESRHPVDDLGLNPSGLRLTDTIARSLSVRHRIERRQADANLEIAAVRANRRDDALEKTRAVLERTAVRPAARPRAEQFMTEVAVARLHVHEPKAGIAR